METTLRRDPWRVLTDDRSSVSDIEAAANGRERLKVSRSNWHGIMGLHGFM